MPGEKSKIIRSTSSGQKSKTDKKERKPVKSLKVVKSEKLEATVISTTKELTKVKAEKKDGLTVDVYDIKGKIVGEIELPKEIFGEKINKTLLSQAVRVYLANQRRGTASTKTRGEVTGSTRKIYKQKGTGRARHGAIRAPIFVGGGIVFGPKPRDYSLKFPTRMKRKALFSALSAKVLEKRIRVIDGIEDIEPKTKVMAQILKALDTKEKNLMLVLPSFGGKNELVYRAARNIEGVKVTSANLLNTYEILRSKTMLFPKSSIEEIKKTFIKGK